MRAYFRRLSVRAAFFGLLIALLAFVPAVLPLLHWERPKWYEVVGGVIAILALWISFVLATFFQQVEVENEIGLLSDFSPSSETISSASRCVTILRDLSRELNVLVARHKNRARLIQQAGVILGDARQGFRKLVGGSFETEFWRCTILREEVENMQDELVGYSPLISEEEVAWWESEEGDQFFEVNRLVLQQGRKITRIFCCNPDDPRVIRVLDSHSSINVRVYIVLIDDAKAILGNEFDESMAVVDGRIAYKSRKEREAAKNIWWCLPEEIEKQSDVLRHLRGNRAKLYKPVANPLLMADMSATKEQSGTA